MDSKTLGTQKLVAARYDLSVTNALYSSILGEVRKFVRSLFPKDFFKSEFIQNSMYSVTSAKDNDDDKMVNERPNLSILMNYEPQEASFAGDPFLFGNLNVFRGAWSQPMIYKRIAYDSNERIYVTAADTRSKHTFDINVRVNSEAQALNIRGYLTGRLGLNRPLFLNKRFIEVPFPTSLINSIAAAKGYDIKDGVAVQAFNELLAKISHGNITYKLNKSSGRFLYFYKYSANLLIKISNYENVDKEVTDKALIHSNVKFTLEVEYENHMNFIAESYQNLPFEDSDMFVNDTGAGAILHWTYTQAINFQLPDGKKMIFNTEIVTDIGQVLDSTPFKPYLTAEVLKYIDHLKTQDSTLALLNDKVVSKLYRDGEEMHLGTDFTINWDSFTVDVIIPHSNYPHRFLIYTDIGELNSFIDSLDTSSNI